MADLQSRIGPKAGGYRNKSWVRPGHQVNSQRHTQSSEHNQWHSRHNDSDTSTSATSEEDPGVSHNSHWDNDNPSQNLPTLLKRMRETSESKSLIERVGPAIEEDSLSSSSRSRNQETHRSQSPSIFIDSDKDNSFQHPKPTITPESIKGDSTMKMVYLCILCML